MLRQLIQDRNNKRVTKFLCHENNQFNHNENLGLSFSWLTVEWPILHASQAQTWVLKVPASVEFQFHKN